ncbi:hypothetical protein LUZ60_017704 [Juncus effusus]|nr:hypothetical protein LUZ60_017704 [Juncus effusus]
MACSRRHRVSLPLIQAVLLLFISHFTTLTKSQDLNSDTSALLAFIAPFRTSNVNWDPNANTCTWKGVTCDQSNRVSELRLPGVGLRGQIPSFTLGNLTALTVISLRKNVLSGPLPPDLGDVATLLIINFESNFFTGNIPLTYYTLSSLTQLNLGGNQLSGQIKIDITKLVKLQMLYLQNNSFTGELPDLVSLTALNYFNVSFNNLSGPIPSSLSHFPMESFLGMPLCGKPLDLCPMPPAHPPAISPSESPGTLPKNSTADVKKHGLTGGAIAGIAIGIIALLLIVTSICIILLKRPRDNYDKRGYAPESEMALRAKEAMGSQPSTPARQTSNKASPSHPMMNNAVPERAAAPHSVETSSSRDGGGAKKRLVFFGRSRKTYDLDDLLRASAEVLGKGAFGTTYKAMLEMGQVVAVKRLKDVNAPEREFRDKITAIGAMDHPNMVPLRAYYYNREEKLLVYDYMAMGSLSALLHGNRGSGRSPLDWAIRSNIALAAARGIEYIHSASPEYAHGNIKSSNILLSGSSSTSPEWARIADHGLAHIAGGPAASLSRGSYGYKAPELTDLRRASHKTDVYSFGVLLLELLTGKAPGHADGVDLPKWVRQENSDQILDVELLRENQVAVDEMMRMTQVAMECLNMDPDRRPPMDNVVRQIEDICDSVKSRDSRSSSIDDTSGERPLNRSGKFV